jgi:hypothetical protein
MGLPPGSEPVTKFVADCPADNPVAGWLRWALEKFCMLDQSGILAQIFHCCGKLPTDFFLARTIQNPNRALCQVFRV